LEEAHENGYKAVNLANTYSRAEGHTREKIGIRRCTYTTFPSSLMVVLMSWDGARKQTTDSRSAISAIMAAAATLNIWWWRNRKE